MILVDCSHAMHRVLHSNKEAVIANPEFLTHLLLSQFLSMSSKFGGSKKNPVVLCLDSSSWRKDFYVEHKPKTEDYKNETYKGRRVKDTSVDWTEVYRIYDDIMNILKQDSDFHVMKVEKAEADDIIAVLATKFKDQEDIWVMSSDKDFVQLQCENVSIYDPLKQAFKPTIDVETFKKIHNIIGDKSDNILPIKSRVAEKTAYKLLPELDVLLKTNPDMREKYEFNETLISFDKIPDWVRENILKEYENQTPKFNATKLMSGFIKYRLSKHGEDINKFKLGEAEVKTKLNQHFRDNKKNIEISSASIEDFFGE